MEAADRGALGIGAPAGAIAGTIFTQLNSL